MPLHLVAVRLRRVGGGAALGLVASKRPYPSLQLASQGCRSAQRQAGRGEEGRRGPRTSGSSPSFWGTGSPVTASSWGSGRVRVGTPGDQSTYWSTCGVRVYRHQ
jgi:hypothetical protein